MRCDNWMFVRFNLCNWNVVDQNYVNGIQSTKLNNTFTDLSNFFYIDIICYLKVVFDPLKNKELDKTILVPMLFFFFKLDLI